MNVKINVTVGVDAAGKMSVLYLGQDGQQAKDVYEKAVSGECAPEIETVYVFIRPDHSRRHEVVRSAAADVNSPDAETKAKQEAEAKKAAEKAKREAEKKAKQEAAAKAAKK
jgi:membrane protein involved in colicin uptake